MTRKMLPAGRGVAVARTQARRGLTRHRCATALLLVAMSGSAYAAQQDLLKPAQLIADGSLPAATRAASFARSSTRLIFALTVLGNSSTNSMILTSWYPLRCCLA